MMLDEDVPRMFRGNYSLSLSLLPRGVELRDLIIQSSNHLNLQTLFAFSALPVSAGRLITVIKIFSSHLWMEKQQQQQHRPP